MTYYMYAPHRDFSNRHPEGAITPSAPLLARVREWRELILTLPGRSCATWTSAPLSAAPFLARDTGRCFFVFTDAALEGAPVPSLGGFLHGYYFSFPLPIDMLGYPIPVLEFLAIVAAAFVFPKILCGAPTVLVTDSLPSSMAFNNDGAHTEEMQWVHLELISATAASQVFAATRHGYGETNPCVDLASRGRLAELHELYKAIGDRRPAPPLQ